MDKRIIRKCFFGLIGVVVVQFISGCVSKIPGTEWGGTYCLQTRYSKAYHDTVKSSEYSYGRYKKYSLGGNHGLCRLAEFHVLKVKWTTKSGAERRENIDVWPLIKEMKFINDVPQSYSSPDLLLEVENRTITLSYKIYDDRPGLERGERRKQYLLYTNTE